MPLETMSMEPELQGTSKQSCSLPTSLEEGVSHSDQGLEGVYSSLNIQAFLWLRGESQGLSNPPPPLLAPWPEAPRSNLTVPQIHSDCYALLSMAKVCQTECQL